MRHGRMGFFRLAIALAFLAAGAAAYAAWTPKEVPPRPLSGPSDRYRVYRIELREAIMGSDVPFFVHRSVVAAQAAKADVVVLDMDTPGGRVDLMMQIRDELIALDMPTYTYVNTQAISAGSLLAIAMDKIVMAPMSTIGGAQVISATGQEIPEKVERKMTSILKAEVRATAKAKGYPVRVCEAFVDSEIDIPGLSPKGEVLTLDQDQAIAASGEVAKSDGTKTTRTLAAFIAEDIDDLLAQEGLTPAQVMSYEMTWSEKMAKYLMHIKPLLLLIGLFAFFIEFKTPGIGVPAAIGIVAFALFFWGSYLADLANVFEIVIFFVGVLLLAMEIFVIPGFGVAGLSGVLLIIVSLVMSMMKLPPASVPDLGTNIVQLRRALWTIIWVFAGLVPLMVLLVRFMPGLPVLRHLVLSPDEAVKAAEEGARRSKAEPLGYDLDLPAEPRSMIGSEGKAVTDLRPAGIGAFGGRRLDVVTDGQYVLQGARIRIVSIHGSVNMVEPLDEPGEDADR